MIRPADSAEEYAAAASATCAPLTVVADPAASFQGRYRGCRVSAIHVARLRSAFCTVSRTARHIAEGDRESVKVMLQLTGSTAIAQEDRRSVLTAGDIVCYDTSRPYRLRVQEASDAVVVGIPRAWLGPREGLLGRNRALAQRTDGRLGRMVTRLVDDLLTVPSGPSDAYVADALVSLILPQLTGPAAARPGPDALVDRILAYCTAHLDDPGLTVTSVAQAHGISVRYLHKVLATREITLSAWVRRRRLELVRRDLADPALAGLTVTAIAGRWGLPDTAHLSRSLRAEFGLSARELRAPGPRASSHPGPGVGQDGRTP